MKTALSTFCIAVLTGFMLNTASAQENNPSTASSSNWTQGRRGIYTIGIGGTQQIRLGRLSGLTRPGLSMNIQGEYAVGRGRIVGLGWGTGVNLYFGGNYTDIQFPVGLKVNVHILDAAHVNVRGLDFYAGMNLGGGPGVRTGPGPNGNGEPNGGRGVVGFLYVGPQVGIRYWFNPHIAINAEFGWGQTFANLGFTF